MVRVFLFSLFYFSFDESSLVDLIRGVSDAVMANGDALGYHLAENRVMPDLAQQEAEKFVNSAEELYKACMNNIRESEDGAIWDVSPDMAVEMAQRKKYSSKRSLAETLLTTKHIGSVILRMQSFGESWWHAGCYLQDGKWWEKHCLDTYGGVSALLYCIVLFSFILITNYFLFYCR